MQNSTLRRALAIVCLLVTFSACHKDDSIKNISVKTPTKDAPNTYFNWETASSMLVSASSPQVSLPWQSQSGNYIDASLVSDYKSNDGWQLVYSTFNTNVIATSVSQPAGGLYFALYNRYRGLIRYYLYIPTGLFGSSSSIEHGLSVYSDNGSTSKMLNFDGVDIVDANGSTPSFIKTNNMGVAVGGGWYAMQYEIAYDPNFSATVYPHLGFTWNSKTVSISQISLNGTNVGTLNGNINQPSSGFDLAGTLINGIVGAVEIYGAVATAGASSALLTAAGSAATGGLAGNITGFLSGIFGGNSNNTQEVDLKLNSTISLNGSLTSSQPLVPNSFVFPGQSTANSVGAPTPLISNALGVFNLTSRPTINVHKTVQTVPVNDGGITIPYNQTALQYTVNQTVFNSLFILNPAVINSDPSTGATIKNLKTEVVIINPNTGYNFAAFGNHETIGSLSTYTGSVVTLQYLTEHALPVSDPSVAIRVSFNIVPNNGAPSSLIVKSFTANIVNN